MSDDRCAGGKEQDPYQQVVEAMAPGLLVSFNNSHGANSQGTPEFQVRSKSSRGLVILDDTGSNEQWKIDRNHADSPVLEPLDTEWHYDEIYVETIEIAGISSTDTARMLPSWSNW